jgi:CHRD domain-containing protein
MRTSKLNAVLAAVAVVGIACPGPDDTTPPITAVEAELSGPNEVPPITSSATASGTFTLVPRGATGSDTLVYSITIGTAFPAGDTITQAHIHGTATPAATAGIQVWLCGSTILSGTPPAPTPGPAGTPACPTGLAAAQTIAGRVAMSTAVLNSIRAYTSYANIHTKVNNGGEIRGQLRLPN